jgi:hypothetical protein
MAAQLIEEEEREQAAKAQSKVRGVELAPVCGVSDAVSLAHVWVASSEVPAAAFLRLSAQCVVCLGWGVGRSRRASSSRARARPRAKRVAGRLARRRLRRAAAARRARRVGRAVAPARCHQQALATSPRWRMQLSPRSLPRRSRAVRSRRIPCLLAAARRRRSASVRSGRGSAGWRRRRRRCR